MDTLFASDEIVPFFMVADYNGGWSVFADTSKYSIPNKTIQNYNYSNTIRAYPNPVISILNIDLSGDSGNPENIVITNISGIEVRRVRAESDHVKINTETLPHGVYIITIGYRKTSFIKKCF